MGGGGRGQVESIVDKQNSFELWHIFQLFYYFNRRLPLTKGLLPMPDGETSPTAKKNITKKALWTF